MRKKVFELNSFHSMKLKEYKWVLDYIQKLPKGIKILDAGCGDGKLVRFLNDRGYDAWGIDVKPLGKGDAIAIRPKRFWIYNREMGWPQIRIEKFKQEDMRKTSFPEKTFDVIFCISTIINVGIGAYGDYKEEDGDRKAIEEFLRILKEDGIIILTLAYGEPCLKKRKHPFRVYDDPALEKLLKELEKIEEHYFHFPRKEGKWIETKKENVIKTFHIRENEWVGNAFLVLKKK